MTDARPTFARLPICRSSSAAAIRGRRWWAQPRERGPVDLGKDFFERIRDLSLGLSAIGLTRGDRVGIISESRPEWLIADLAILTAAGVTVPVYPTLAAQQARYILHDAGARWVFVSNADQAAKVQEVRHELPALEAIITIEPGAATGGSVLTLDEVARAGHAAITGSWGVAKESRIAARAIPPGDLATLIYTSGTTGEPKGVMLTHANLASNMHASSEALRVNDEDVALSFLPLSHAFERRRHTSISGRGRRSCSRSRSRRSRATSRRPADGDDRGPARLREAARAHHARRGRLGPFLERLPFQWARRQGGRRGG